MFSLHFAELRKTILHHVRHPWPICLSHSNKDRTQLALMSGNGIICSYFFFLFLSCRRRQRQTVDSSSAERKQTITLNLKEMRRRGHSPFSLMQNVHFNDFIFSLSIQVQVLNKCSMSTKRFY